jgi:hypothetical protein
MSFTSSSELELHAYADWGPCLDSRRSLSGYALLFLA